MTRRRRRALYAVPAVAALALVSAASRVAAADDAACVAASEQSLTLRQQGKLHETLKQLAVCADPACPDEVKTECASRIAAVDQAMPTLVLAAKDGAGHDLTAVTVTIDGVPAASSLDGLPLSIDPGPHAFHFEMAGQPPLDTTFVLREGQKDRHETVVLGPPAPPPQPPVAPPLPPIVVPTMTPAPLPVRSWSGRKTLALVSGGVGLAGIGVGIVLGAFAISSHNREQSDCSLSSCSNHAQGTEDYDTATKDATGSTIAFIAGGAFLAAGVVLWLTAPPPSATQTGGLHLAPVIVGRGGVGLALGGAL